MSIAIPLDRADRHCQRCGLVVAHTLTEAWSHEREENVRWWRAERHIAPCGMPCSSGGIRPKRPDETGGVRLPLHEQAHGFKNKQGTRVCPMCGDLAVDDDRSPSNAEEG